MKYFTDLFGKMDKTKWLILGLGGMLLLVIAIPAGSGKTKENVSRLQQSTQGQETSYEKRMESELADTLGLMDGVGKVRVMITFSDSGENVVEKDITKSEDNAGQTDGERRIQYEEETVYAQADGQEPYVARKMYPNVTGVLVIAQGGGDSRVRQDISEAVQALFSIEAHRIKIVRMQE